MKDILSVICQIESKTKQSLIDSFHATSCNCFSEYGWTNANIIKENLCQHVYNT